MVFQSDDQVACDGTNEAELGRSADPHAMVDVRRCDCDGIAFERYRTLGTYCPNYIINMYVYIYIYRERERLVCS